MTADGREEQVVEQSEAETAADSLAPGKAAPESPPAESSEPEPSSTPAAAPEELPKIDPGRIGKALKISGKQVTNTVALLDEGNTVPFITRYRKERTGGLDEEQIRAIQRLAGQQRQLKSRMATILRSIEEQGKLTDELRAEIESSTSMKQLEDLYLPYRPKRRTRAMIAKERGLEPLADRVWAAEEFDLAGEASALVSAEKELPDSAAVLAGVSDILAERMADDARIRGRCRRIARQSGEYQVSATRKGQEHGFDFRDYFQFKEPIKKIPPHRLLAINRGDKLGMLSVKYVWDRERAIVEIQIYLRLMGHPHAELVLASLRDAIDRLLHPSLDREIRGDLTEDAERHAIGVFAKNLRNLLMQPPLPGKRILAIDPGMRTGCKVAAIDETGKLLAHDVLFLHEEEKRPAAKERLKKLLAENACPLVAIGNGTGCRDAELLVSEVIEEDHPDVRYTMVNEAGASIYSASTVARDEFPELDATVRGTVSIARRLQDPLSELVKIDPEHVGVGMYQHDVDGKRLKESLGEVVESCVNQVGADLNSASAPLLRYIAGFNQLTARRVVEYRDANGAFRTREQLKEVQGVGDATFTQAAGFLRVRDGDEPLDNTPVHPESYPVAHAIFDRVGVDRAILNNDQRGELGDQIGSLAPEEVASQFAIGDLTLRDILNDLAKPGRDPRGELAGSVFRAGVLKIEDLERGMELTGSVLNVVDFGAFVDIGLKESGLVHVSQMANEFVDDPHRFVSVGDTVTVWVLTIDHERGRVALSLKGPPEAAE